MSTATDIQEIYIGLLGRAADKAGLAYWTNQIDTNVLTLEQLRANIVNEQPEYQTGLGSLTREATVIELYNRMFERTVDGTDSGVQYWTTGGGAGVNVDQLVLALSNGALDADKTTLTNKTTAAVFFSTNVADGQDTNANAQAAVDSVDSTAASVTASENATKALGVTTGETFNLTTSTTDVLVGTNNNDTFSGDATTYQNTDRIIDAATFDNDTLNLTVTDDVTPDVVNVENINITQNNLAAKAVDAASITGAKVLTVTRGDVVVGGSTLNGNKAVKVDNADSAGVAKIVAGAGATSLDINAAAADKAGLEVDASVVTGDVTVDGAATINADASTGTVAVDAVSNTDATETAKATTINAAKAATVTTHANLTGAVTVNAANASTITVNDAQGGATVTGATTSTADSTITVADVDDSGVTITTGTGSATAAEKQVTINIDGTTKTTDTATINATGVVALDLDAGGANTVDVVTLSGQDGAVTYNIGTNAETITSITKAGTNSVTVAGNEDEFSGVTINNIDVVDLNAGTAGAIDASKWNGVGKIDLGFDNAGNGITVANAAKVEITTSQTGLDFDYATGAANLTLVAGDVNGASTAVGTATVGALEANAGATAEGTVTIEANDANLTATSTVVGAKQNIVVTGDEDVSLGAVTAKTLSAAASTGILTATSAGNVESITGGAGNDQLTANADSVHILNGGNGNDTLTITDAAATSQFSGGEGNDTFTMTETATAYVAVGGAGDDTFTAGDDFDAVIVGGEGTDTLTLTGAADFTGRANFAFSSIEKINLGGNAVTLDSAQFANNNTVELTGTTTVTVQGKSSTAGNTINASGVTLATGSTATLVLQGNAKNDTITGSSKNDTINGTAGDDTIDGGAGTDTFVATSTAEAGTGVGSVINLGTAAISGTEVLNKTTLRTAGDSAVAAGTSATTFNDTDSANNASVSTLSNIENATGTAGQDYIVGSSANNTLNGAGGNDYIDGGDGVDTIDGGAGNDTIKGGLGNDNLTGGANDDTFVTGLTQATNGTDTIADFGTGTNVIDLDGLTNADLRGTGASFESVAKGANAVAANTGIVLQTGDEANLNDATALAAANTMTGWAAGDVVYFIATDGTDSALYRIAETSGDTTLDSVEKLITFTGVDETGFAAANFADFA